MPRKPKQNPHELIQYCQRMPRYMLAALDKLSVPGKTKSDLVRDAIAKTYKIKAPLV